MRKLLSAIRLYRSVDAINNPLANATSPDALIVAKIVQSFATSFDDWTANYDAGAELPKLHPLGKNDHHWKSADRHTVLMLSNSKMDITIEARYTAKKAYRAEKIFAVEFDRLAVNGVELEPALGREIHTEYRRVKTAIGEAKRVAEEAKKAMAANEKKWNLAERVLGMKRLSNGALVPTHTIATAPHCCTPGTQCACDCDDCSR